MANCIHPLFEMVGRSTNTFGSTFGFPMCQFGFNFSSSKTDKQFSVKPAPIFSLEIWKDCALVAVVETGV